jgi:hypothetical protein
MITYRRTKRRANAGFLPAIEKQEEKPMEYIKKAAAVLMTITIAFSLSACSLVEEETAPQEPLSSMVVNIVNQTGQTIGDLRMSLAADEEWGENLLETELKDKEVIEINLGEFSQKDLDAGFNIQACDEIGMELYDETFSANPTFFKNGNYLILCRRTTAFSCRSALRIMPIFIMLSKKQGIAIGIPRTSE